MKCFDAYKNINIMANGGELSVSPCCYSPTVKVEKVDFVNDTYLNSIRKSWDSGVFPASCNGCERQEQLGKPSRRIGSNQWYSDNASANSDVELIRMDFWTGDICNLRCAICGPKHSSGWKQELSIPSKKSNINRFWKEIDLSTIKFIHFNGGEPLLSKEHVLLLKAIPVKKSVHLNYNTNGTILPSDELLRLWDEFKIVQLDFSIDDIGDRFEYQRYPAKWADVVGNMKWFIDNCPVNCMFSVNTTVSMLNQHNIQNLDEWLKSNFHSNRVTDPIEHRKQPAFGLFSTGNPKLTNQMVDFLNGCDERRGTNWRLVFPELI